MGSDSHPLIRALGAAGQASCREAGAPRHGGMLRVSIVTETYPPEVNGVAMTAGRLVDGLLERGHHVQVIRPRQSGEQAATARAALEEQVVAGVPLPGYAGLRFGLPAPYRLRARWRACRPDAVHIVTEGPLGWSALRAARALGLPVSSGFHTNFHEYSRHYGLGWATRSVAGYLRSFHNRTDATVVPTAALAARLRGEGYRNLHVVARGVDLVLFHPRRRSLCLRRSWGATEHDLVALYVGRVAPEKNLPLALRAFRALRLWHPEARLVVVGDGPLYRQLAAENPHCLFAGTRRGEDLARHYASADLFLFPSLTETYGNVTAEAMASGLAVLAFDYAAAAQLIRNGCNGMLVAWGDEQGFIDAALGLAHDVGRLRHLGARARSSVAALSWSGVADQFAALLARLSATGPSTC